MANTYSAGIVTAYGAAKKAGYTGTYEEFCAEQASFARNAQQVRQDKESVEQTVEAFSETTVPAAVQSVTDEGTEQVERVTNVGTTAVGNVNDAGTTQVGNVNNAGTTQVGNVNSAGTTQVGNVNEAGTNQVNAVNTAGATQVQTVEDKGAEVLETIPADYTKLSNAVFDGVTGLNSKAPVILETVSGAIASFDDGADNMPIKKLVAQIEPVQDLHGYDHPWPAGGGKNLFDKDNVTGLNAYIDGSISQSSGQRMVYIPCKPNTTYTAQKIAVAGDVSDRFTFAYTTTVPANGVTVYEQRVRPTPTTIGQKLSLTLTTGADAQYLVLWISQSEGYDASLLTTMIAEESSASAYSPYSNICPISGWTGAEVTRTGKNLCDGDFENGAYNLFSLSRLRLKRPIRIFKGKTYTFSSNDYTNFKYVLNTGSSPTWPWAGFQYAGNSGLWTYGPITFTATKDAWLSVIVSNRTDSSITPADIANLELQIEIGSTATAYEPYTGNQISVTFPDEAGTVYGGTLDAVRGKLVVDRAFVSFDGSENWSLYTSIPNHFQVNEPNVLQNDQNTSNSISNQYTSRVSINSQTASQGVFSADGNRIRIKDDRFSTVADFKAFLAAQYNANTPVEVVYKLATPIEYTLTANELSTLYGQNNIWTDVGSVSVDYPADTKLYIDNKIAEAIAAL